MNPPASAPARPNNQGTQSPSDGWSVQPQRIKRHRTAGDVLKGLGALLVLVVLLGAIPFALVRYIGWPLPHEMPSSSFFNQSITPDVLLKALAVIVWLAWAQFAACVVVEFRAAVRGIGMPARVPAAGPSQFLARQLIAALLMITASAASFVPNLAHLGAHSSSPAAAPPAATAGVLPGSAQHPAIGAGPHAANAGAMGAGGAYNSAYNLPAVRGESGLRVASDTAATLSDGTKLYRVQPPLGRHHDTLWEIAQRHLGDGRRYKEIYELNKDRVQPDGSRLTNAALIRPGWILMMPPDATGGDLVIEMPSSPPQALGPAQSSGTQSGTSGSSDQIGTPGSSNSSNSDGTTGTTGSIQSATLQSDAPHSDALQPGALQSGATQPEPTQPASIQPDSVQSGSINSDTTHTDGLSQPTHPQTASSALKPVPTTTLPPIIHLPRSSTNTPATTSTASTTPSADVVPAPAVAQFPVAQFPVAQSADELAERAAAAAASAADQSDAEPPATAPSDAAPSDAAPSDSDHPAAAPSITTATDDTALISVADTSSTPVADAPTAPTPITDTSDDTTATDTTVADASIPTVTDALVTDASIAADAASTSVTPPTAPTPAQVPAPTPESVPTPLPPSAATSVPALIPVHQDTTTTTAGLALRTPAALATTPPAAQDGPGPGPSAPRSHRGAHSPEESQPPSTDNRVLYGLAASPLLAAGLLKAIARHRRRQLWNRVFGRRPVTPNGDGAVAEESIRVGASEVEVWFLDLALRGLSAGLAERGITVPGAYAARLRDEGIELLLNKPVPPGDPATQPPAPWFASPDGRSWNFPRPGIVDVDAQAAHRRFAPYPGLVTIGTAINAHGSSAPTSASSTVSAFAASIASNGATEPAGTTTSAIDATSVNSSTNVGSSSVSNVLDLTDTSVTDTSVAPATSDRLMIDLEEARGLIGLDGPPEIRRAVLAALAVELATNSWSDRMTVTLVGFPGDLTPLAPARVRHVRTLDEILPSLEIEAGERAKALAVAGLESVLDGRSRASQASSFPPHFVLISEEPHAAIVARLSSIATTAARVGLGFIVAGNPLGATWQLTVSSDRRITAPALGLEAQVQLLPEEQYAAVLGLFRAVCDIEGTDIAAQSPRQSVGYGGPLPDEPPSVYAALLGSLQVTGVEKIDGVEPEHVALLNEALVFLLHHRDGVHPRVLAAALWPRGTTADVAEATFARLGTWLGTDPHGKPNLHTDTEGRLRLGPYVWSDWDMFVSLQSRALYDASITDQSQRDDVLKSALDLVRGPYLADREPNRYGWLAYEVAEAQVPAVIADTALQLADSFIASDAPEAAIEAVKAGMRGSPDDEELWRGLLRATSATQDTERLRGAIEGLYKRTWYVHGVQGLHPRTEALVNRLMPHWRELVAA